MKEDALALEFWGDAPRLPAAARWDSFFASTGEGLNLSSLFAIPVFTLFLPRSANFVAPASGRDHQLEQHAHQQQAAKNLPPEPSGEPVAVVVPERSVNPTECEQSCKACEDGPNNAGRPQAVNKAVCDCERPSYRINGGKASPTPPVRNWRRRFTCNDDPHGSI